MSELDALRVELAAIPVVARLESPTATPLHMRPPLVLLTEVLAVVDRFRAAVLQPKPEDGRTAEQRARDERQRAQWETWGPAAEPKPEDRSWERADDEPFPQTNPAAVPKPEDQP